jgi:hypothetical protein
MPGRNLSTTNQLNPKLKVTNDVGAQAGQSGALPRGQPMPAV